MLITAAQPSDLAGCHAIYAHHVLHGTGTFEEVPPGEAEFSARHQGIVQAGFAWNVAREGSKILGYAYYGPFRTRAAYRFTVEDSVYVSPDAQGKGVGRALLAALLAEAEAAGLKQMLALIGDSQNAASVGLHTALGFAPSGVMRDVGFKFGRWLDVVVMQRELSK